MMLEDSTRTREISRRPSLTLLEQQPPNKVWFRRLDSEYVLIIPPLSIPLIHLWWVGGGLTLGYSWLPVCCWADIHRQPLKLTFTPTNLALPILFLKGLYLCRAFPLVAFCITSHTDPFTHIHTAPLYTALFPLHAIHTLWAQHSGAISVSCPRMQTSDLMVSGQPSLH